MAVPGLRLFQTGGLPTFPRPFIPSTRCSDGAGAIFLPPAFGASKRRCDAAFRPLNLLRRQLTEIERQPAGGGAALAG